MDQSATKLLGIEKALRAAARRLEDYRIAKDADSEELDGIFEEMLEQADQVRMIAQPIVVSHEPPSAPGVLAQLRAWLEAEMAERQIGQADGPPEWCAHNMAAHRVLSATLAKLDELTGKGA